MSFTNILKQKYILLILIVIIASFLRLYQINQVPLGLYPDEAMNGNNALEALSSPNIAKSILTFGNSGDGFRVFYPENNGREGLFINIQAISVLIFGNYPWALRLISALFGIFTVLGLYFLVQEMFRKKPSPGENDEETPVPNSLFKIPYVESVALLSSFLLATSFWHINFSRIGFRAIMSPFFLIWALYFLLLSFRKIQNNQNFLKIGALAGAVFGLGFYSYIAYRATPILILVAFFHFWLANKDSALRKKFYKLFFIFVIFALIVFLPLGFYFAVHPQDFFGRTGQISVFSSDSVIKDLSNNILKTIAMFNFKGDGNWRHNFADRPELFWPVGIMFLAGLICSILHLFKKSREKEITPVQTNITAEPVIVAPTPERPITAFDSLPIEEKKSEPPPLKPVEKACGPIINKFPFILLFTWIIIAALPIVISNEGLPHALRAIIMIPPIFILAGFGGIQFLENIIKKIFKKIGLQKALTIIIIIFLLLEGYYTYFIKWGRNENVLGAFAQNYVDLGNELNLLPKEMPKYVIVKAGGTDVRGLPMPTQTTMFITDTFSPEKQKEKNIFYVLSDQVDKIPAGSHIVVIE